jgi:hypothetical protein
MVEVPRVENYLVRYGSHRRLDSGTRFDQIYMTLFSHGVESIGLASIQQWRSLLGRARVEGEFIGVTPQPYPRDFAVMTRYSDEISKKIRARYPWPGFLRLGELDRFLNQNHGRYAVEFTESKLEAPARSKLHLSLS